MATIAKLVMRIEAELRPLQTQLRQASRDVTKFAADMNRSFGKVPNLTKALLPNGAEVGAALKDIEKSFDRTFNQLRNQAKKSGDFTGFSDQLRAAVQNAKRETQSIIGQAQQAGAVTGRQARGLIARSERNAIKAETNILIGEAQHSLQNLENQFRATQTSLTQRRVGKNVGTAEFRELGRQAEAEFNAAWDKEMRRFAQDPRFTEPMRQALTRQFKSGGFGFDAASIPIAKSIDAAKEQANAYVRTYQKTVQSAKFGNLTGDLTGRQFKKALADANKELAAGLKNVRDQLNAQGLLTPEALKFLNSQFQNAGKTAATGFFSTFDKAMSENFTGLQRFAGVATQVGGTMTKFLTLPLLGAAGAAIKLAGDAEQANRKLESTFGPFSQDLARQLAGLRKEIPATSAELVNMAATFGELLIPLGLAPAKVAEMSVQLIKAAKNVAVFRGVSTERGFNAVVNALIGQSRELKKLGIEIDDRTIRDEAYRQGLARVGAQLSTTQKVMAGYSVIMQRTKLVQNTLQDQQNTFNVRLLFLQAALKETGIAFGTVLLPAMIAVINKTNDLLLTLQELSPTTKTIAAGFAIFTAVLGPLLIILGAFLRALIVIRAAMIALPFAGGAGAAGASGGIAAALGITAVSAGQILAVVAAIGLLAVAFKEYEKELGDFQGISNDVIRNIQSMTRSELVESAKGQKILENWFLAQRQALKQSAGITEGPFGFTTGGTVAQRQEFNRLGQKVEETRAIYARINDEIKTVDATNLRLGKDAEAVAARWKAAQENVRSELLVETLAKARIQLRLLRTEATAASVAVNKGTTIDNAEMITRGIEKARETLSAVEGLNSQFKQLRLEPENQVIGKELDEVITKTGKLKDELTALLAKSENTKVLSEFGARLAELRKQLQLGSATNDVELISRGFGNLASLQQDVQRRLTEAAEAGDKMLQLRLNTILLTLATLEKKFSTFAPTAFLKQIDSAIERLKLLKELAPEGTITSTGVASNQRSEQAKQVEQLVIFQDELNRRIAETEERHGDTSILLRKQVEIAKAIKENTPDVFDLLFGDDMLPKIQRIADALKIATSQEESARAVGDVTLAEKAHLAVLAAQADIGRLRQQIIDLLTGAGIGAAQQSQILSGLNEAFKRAGVSAGDMADNVDKGTRRLLRMGQLVAVIRQVAEAFGLVGGNIDKALTSLGTMLTSIEALRKANAEFNKRRAEQAAKTGADPSTIGRSFEESLARISSIIGTVVAAFNVVRSIGQALFGKSATEVEHDRILKENNRHLDEMRLALEGFTATIGNQTRVFHAISSPEFTAAIHPVGDRSQTQLTGPPAVQTAQVIRILAKFGLTLAQVNEIAKANGIQILDEKGRIVAKAFDQLLVALELSRAAFFKYQETLSDLTTKQDLFNNVFNVPDTGDQAVRDQLSLLEQLAPDLFKQFFGGIDLTDQKAVEAALQALTQALLDGSLEATDALKLLNRGELESIITNMANGFDKLRDATDKLTESELNVPTWFKRAQVRLESVAATIENATPPITPPQPRQPTPLTPSVPPPPNPKVGQQDVQRVNSDAMSVASMNADVLTVSRVEMPDIPPVPVALDTSVIPTVPPVAVTVAADVTIPDVRPIPVTLVASSIPTIPPIAVTFDTPSIPDIQPVPVTLDTDALTALLANLPAVPVTFTLPDLPDLPAIPVRLDTSSLESIPPIPVTASADVRLPEIPPVPVTVSGFILPEIPPITVALVFSPIPDVPSVSVTVSRVDVPDVPPITVTVARLVVPEVPPVTASVVLSDPPAVPPIPVTFDLPALPDIPAVRVTFDPSTIPSDLAVSLDVSSLPASIPVALDLSAVPDIPPIPVALDVSGIPASLPPIAVTATADVTLPALPPIPVAVGRISVPDIPPVPVALDTSNVPVIPPIPVKLDLTALPAVPPIAITVVRIELPDIPPVTADVRLSRVPDVPPIAVTFDVPRLPEIRPIPVTFDAANVPASLPVKLDTSALQTSIPVAADVMTVSRIVLPTIPPISVRATADVTVPEIPPVPVAVSRIDLPPVEPVALTFDVPSLPEIPPIPAIAVTVDTSRIPSTVPVALDASSLATAIPVTADVLSVSRVVLPRIAPISVAAVADVVLSDIPEIPPVPVVFDTSALSDIAPVSLTATADVVLSDIPALPPLPVTFDLSALPVIPPIPVSVEPIVIPDIPPISVSFNTSSIPTTAPVAAETPVQTTRSANPSGSVDEPTVVDSGGDTITVQGPLIGSVVQQRGESTDELADRIVAKLRRTRFNRTGSSSLPGVDD